MPCEIERPQTTAGKYLGWLARAGTASCWEILCDDPCRNNLRGPNRARGFNEPLYNGRLAALKTKSGKCAKLGAQGGLEALLQLEVLGRLTSPGRWVTLSRMVRNERPLRISATKPSSEMGMVSARKAKIENPVAVVFST